MKAFSFHANGTGKLRKTVSRTAALATLPILLCATQLAHAATAAGTSITNQASATYTDAALGAHSVTSNTVVTIVQQVASVTLTANGAQTVAPGAQVSYAHTLTNSGNGPDTFTFSVSNTGSVTLNNVLFYADANGDGVADNAIPLLGTGILAAGGTFKFVAVGTVPNNAAAGSTNTLTVTANGLFTPAVTTSNTDTTTISAVSAMDITSNSAGPGAPGAGAGPEVLPMAINAVNPGGTTRFTLYLNNSGNTSDTFNLQASTDSTFGGLTLPSGWTVVFKDASNAVITSSTVNASGNTLVYADVTVPGGATAGATDLFFRALSPTTTVSDRLHDSVIVLPSLGQVTLVKTQAIDANCDGVADVGYLQTSIAAGAVPGACVRYQITATNIGITNVTSVVVSDPTPGSTTYHATVPASTTIGTVTAPSNGATGTIQASVGTLTPGQSAVVAFGVRINP